MIQEVIGAWSTGSNLEEFGDEGNGPRRLLLNPAIFELLGDVRGKRVLAAGCGQGYLSRLPARRGATVTGVESEPRYRGGLLNSARRRASFMGGMGRTGRLVRAQHGGAKLLRRSRGQGMIRASD